MQKVSRCIAAWRFLHIWLHVWIMLIDTDSGSVAVVLCDIILQ